MLNIIKITLYLLWLAPVFTARADKGKLTGTVRDSLGNPLAGATLSLQPDQRMGQTDENGAFTFERLYEGTYQLRVSALGCQTFNRAVTVFTGKTTVLNIQMERGENLLNEVLISGKRDHSPDNLLDIERGAMPVTVISKERIALMGSRRLDEVLKEQTGLAIVNNISGGARSVGLQMQGFGSEYVMVLIDGQPMAGRNDGNFDLSRISVSNIERIEIIKGASSCLFGSDALGGAINIVTKHGALQPQALAAVKYGSLNILDATLEGESPFASQRGSVNLSANYYRTDGFNTDPGYFKGTTAPPYDNFGLQGRSRYRLSKKTTAGISGRYANRISFMPKDFGLNTISEDTQREKDLNLSAHVKQHLDHRWQSLSRYYYTHYQNDMTVRWQQRNELASQEKFSQNLHRFEQQFSYKKSSNLKFTAGLGAGVEQIHHGGFGIQPDGISTGFTYVQSDWQVSEKLGVVGGLRYDWNSSYNGKLNPSIGLQYLVHPKITFKLAAGSGYKAPDLKNRYQVFYNSTANYMVVGTEILSETLEELQEAGQISEIRQHLLKQLAANLKAERSLSLNAGFAYVPVSQLKIEVGAFYHRISNQINSIQVATGSNNRQIFTYQNLPKAINTGTELTVVTTPAKNLELSLGYQYLVAKDLSVADSIAAGKFPYHSLRNNETGETRKSVVSDYWGIENRSRHMMNLRLFYRHTPTEINASLRVNYRGKYPFGDANNNAYIDSYDTFVSGFYLINASVEKKLMNERLSLQITADNIFDYTDRLIPGQAGRVLLLGLRYSWF